MIDPLSLNEAQGLTVEMLRAYVEENQLGIQVRDDLGAELDTLSLLTGKSIQELLREMNPRMVGLQFVCVPLEELHPGKWLVRSHQFCVLNASEILRGCYDERWVWPVNDYGDKIRWPERDGQMLGIKSPLRSDFFWVARV